MARRPTLYELHPSVTRGRTPTPPPTPEREPEDGGGVDLAGWLSAGRAVRVPIGYLFVAAAIVLGLAVGAYVLGHSHGEADAEAARRAGRLAALENEQIAAGIGAQERGERGAGTVGPPATGGSRQGVTGSSGAFPPIETDPRRPGLYYHILVHTTRENAVKVAEFVREEGVEAHVTGANNNSLVFVVPGYRAEDRDTEAVRRLVDRLKAIRTKWRVEHGRDELDHLYTQRHE